MYGGVLQILHVFGQESKEFLFQVVEHLPLCFHFIPEFQVPFYKGSVHGIIIPGHALACQPVFVRFNPFKEFINPAFVQDEFVLKVFQLDQDLFIRPATYKLFKAVGE